MRIWFKLPRTGREPVVDRRCGLCGHDQVHIHQHQLNRPIVDWKLDTIEQVRVKCPRCGGTATGRPGGVTAGRHRTDGVCAYGVLLYALGLSYEAVAAAIRSLAGRGSKSTIYRDVRAAGEKAQQWHTRRQGRAVRVIGVDGTGQKIKGGNVGVGVAVDAEQQRLVGVELVEEEDEKAVRKFLEALCRQYRVQMILTDEHGSYTDGMKSRKIGAAHRLCEAHWKKSKQRRIAVLKAQAERRGYRQWVEDLQRLSDLIRDRPRDGPDWIEPIHRRYLKYPAPGPGGRWSPGYHMRMLTLHLMETWQRLGAGDQTTNNTTERLIGLLLKIRSKTMRGFARADTIPRFVHLMAYLWENRQQCELSALC